MRKVSHSFMRSVINVIDETGMISIIIRMTAVCDIGFSNIRQVKESCILLAYGNESVSFVS